MRSLPRLLQLIAALLLCLPVCTPGMAQDGDAVDIAGQDAARPAEAAPQPVPVSEELPRPGGANVAESGPREAGPQNSPSARPNAVAVPLPPGAGTTSSGGAVVSQPSNGKAGNAADSSRGGPDGRGREANAADAAGGRPADRRDPGLPPDLESDRRLFGELPDEELPGIARGQRGAIDSPPGGMLQSQPLQGFGTLLPQSLLPPGEVSDIVAQRAGFPGYELQTNFGRLVVPTGTITGSTRTKQFRIEGGLIVYYDQVTIRADKAEIDEKEEIAVLSGNVSITDPKYTLSTDELRIRFEDKLFQATGYVQFRKLADSAKSQPRLDLPKKDRLREYFAGQQFELYCMDLHYNWDTKQLIALEGVRMVHPSFSGTMDRVDYDDKSKQYAITGSVKLELDKYDWIFANQLVDAADEDKARALSNNPTAIECDRLLYSEDSGLAQFFSEPGKKVVFDQRERKIEAAYLELNDTTKDFHVEGTTSEPLVFSQSNGQWLFAAGLIKADETAQELQDTLSQPMSLSAQRMTYNFDRKRLELNGAVKLSGDGKSFQAENIVQDETAKYFLMQGNVVIEPDKDSKVYAAQVYLDTENDVVSFVGLVQGHFRNDDIAAAAATGGATEAGGPLDSGTDLSGLFGAPPGGLPPGSSGSALLPGTGPGANVAEGR